MGDGRSFPPEGWDFSTWQKNVWNETLDLSLPQFVVINAGRGAGKDIIALRCALRDALKLYATKKADIKAGKNRTALNPIVKVWLCAESEANLTQTRLEMEGLLRELQTFWGLPEDGLFRHIQRENKFVVFGRGEIEIDYKITSREGSLRGAGVDICCWTEFAEIRESAFKVEFKGTINRAGRLGRTYLYSTPKGPFGLFHELAEIAKKDESGVWKYYHATSFDNEFLTPEQVQRIRAEEKTDGWVYKQERLAEFVIGEFGGFRVFDSEYVQRCYVNTPLPSRPDHISIGVDIARFGDDWTVFLVLDKDSGQILKVERYQKTSGPEIVGHLERLHGEWGNPEFVMDQTQHQSFVSDFAPKHIRINGMKIYDKEKERLVLNLRHLLQINRIKIPDPEHYQFNGDTRSKNAIKELLKEIFQFQKIVNQTGGVRYTHPPNGHDDTLYALMLAADPIARKMKGKIDRETVLDKLQGIF
jgi:hypothetical protein